MFVQRPMLVHLLVFTAPTEGQTAPSSAGKGNPGLMNHVLSTSLQADSIKLQDQGSRFQDPLLHRLATMALG